MSSRAPRHPIVAAGFVLPLWLTMLVCGPPATLAQQPKVAFLAAESSPNELAPENQAARRTAERLCKATLLVVSADGQFVDKDGHGVGLDQFDVLWYHKGGSVFRTAIHSGKPLAAVRERVTEGGGLLLTGGALEVISPLRLETGILPQARNMFHPFDRETPAGIVPVERDHPAFRGLQPVDGEILVSQFGPRAIADFSWGGPANGMILAKTPHGVENPLVEYELGAGRVITLGWRLADYAHAENVHRGNLERLTSNLLDYLGDKQKWQKVVVRSSYQPPLDPAQTSIGEAAWRSLEMAIRDLSESFPEDYPQGRRFLERLAELRRAYNQAAAGETTDGASHAPGTQIAAKFLRLKQEALLANPLLDFARLLVIKRSAANLGLPMNYQSNSSLPPSGYDNQIATLSPVDTEGKLTTLFRPEKDRFVGDVDLDFDGRRMLFSMPDDNDRWRVYQISVDGSGLQQLPLIDEPDVDNYDACYLPDGRIVFTSTAPFVGVPCVGGRSHVTNLYLLETDGSIRQLTVDQDHDWCPVVMNNGRVMYQRWEYTDAPHTFYRLLFQMNPDGTGQMEYYGSNSYWPTAMFYARPMPDHPTKVVAVVGGHHDYPRMGELVILDPALGRFETQGAVQRIPGHGKKIQPVILDGLTTASWPKFLHPFPLSQKYFLVSCKPTPTSLWGIYLVDVFDNFLLIHQEPGYAILEPVPVKPTPRPPVVPDKVDLTRQDAEVFLADVYSGEGLRGVSRGTVKALRLLTYHFAYHGMGGEPDRVGLDGPWDVKRILGTVPVESDGSARFRVPASTPISVQPLDADGKAVALMRSWFTAMPGEVLSCVGCHERQSTSPPSRPALAATRSPSEIASWYGPPRGFSFKREVQPVLDEYCVGCHDGGPRPDGREIPDLTARDEVQVRNMGYNARFTPSYYELRKLVRSPTIESDLHLLPPREFHAGTTRLVQMLEKGHHNVKLDREAWDRLIAWIDLHTPAHGTWAETCGEDRYALVQEQRARRRAMRRAYTGIDEDPEEIIQPSEQTTVQPVIPQPLGTPDVRQVECPGWPFDAAEARRRQTADGSLKAELIVELADGVALELVRVPAGEAVMGDAHGCLDERPLMKVTVDRGFWMGRFEVTNRQFALFDPAHDSRLEHGDFLQFGPYQRGYPLDSPRQPVVRVSWHRAMAFCDWLSGKTGRRFTLPTEAQWEYACRAGTATPLWYGSLESDFSESANVSDTTHQSVDYPHVPHGVPPWRPADTRFDDGYRVSAPVGRFQANPWGLHDMHGNVAEWTLSVYRPFSLAPTADHNNNAANGKRTVRGGSWYDTPTRCRSAFRQAYVADQVVYDVGFRVVSPIEPAELAAR